MKFFNLNKTSSSDEISALVVSVLGKLFHTTKPELIQVKVNLRQIEIHFPFVLDAVWDEVKSALTQALGPDFSYSKHYNVPIVKAQKPSLRNIKIIITISSVNGGCGNSASPVNVSFPL